MWTTGKWRMISGNLKLANLLKRSSTAHRNGNIWVRTIAKFLLSSILIFIPSNSAAHAVKLDFLSVATRFLGLQSLQGNLIDQRIPAFSFHFYEAMHIRIALGGWVSYHTLRARVTWNLHIYNLLEFAIFTVNEKDLTHGTELMQPKSELCSPATHHYGRES